MALDGSYAGLQATIKDFLNRTDLDDTIPDFIALAEADMSKRLVMGGAPRDMIVRVAAPISVEFETVPVDFLGAISLRIEGSDKPLEFTRPEEIAKRQALYPSQSGDPQIYTVIGTEFQFWPVPSDGMIADLIYIKSVPRLNDSIQSNWLLKLHPDCYLYASLIASAPYLKDDDRIAVWEARYDRSVAMICESGKRGLTAQYLNIPTNPNVV